MKKNDVFSFQALAAALFFCLGSAANAAQTAGDSITTVADKGGSGMFLAALCPDRDVAIDKDSAEVFSIYTDNGYPNFLKMRVRSGKYVIKAGDCAIIKTPEVKTIPLEEISGKSSSVFINNIICPAEDTSISDFIVQNSVGSHEYIYMLTNMEKNGGFGFTHFTGDVIRKGSFYIVSTEVPETTGMASLQESLSSKDRAIYDLQGRKVTVPQIGGLYICNGKKYIQRPDNVATTSVPMLPDSRSLMANTVRTRADKDIEDGDQVPFLAGEAGNDEGF